MRCLGLAAVAAEKKVSDVRRHGPVSVKLIAYDASGEEVVSGRR